MRMILPLLTLLACTSENELRYTSTLSVETAGVAFSDDGLSSFAAMSGTTCTINTAWGCPTADTDLPTSSEAVVDHYHGQTLAKSAQGVHRITRSGWDSADDLRVTHVHAAKLTDFGRLVLHQPDAGCALIDEDRSVAVPAAACAEGVRTDVDRRTGALYAATAEGILRLSTQGVQTVSTRGDLVARDSQLQSTYVAMQRGSAVWAIDDAGTTLWSAPSLPLEQVQSITTRGDKGDVLVLGTRGDRGVILRLEGGTGKLKSQSEVPVGDGEIVVSGNGQTLAVVLTDQVHFYAIDVDGESPVLDPDPPSCIEIRTQGTID